MYELAAWWDSVISFLFFNGQLINLKYISTHIYRLFKNIGNNEQIDVRGYSQIKSNNTLCWDKLMMHSHKCKSCSVR